MYIVLMRGDSCRPIEQRIFEHYDEAKTYFAEMCEFYTFCKLCHVLEESNYV